MKQSEKLDLILRELYKFRYDGKQHSIESICEILQIPLSSHIEVVTLALRLKEDGYIDGSITHHISNVEITSYGIEYCEENSYSNEGHSLITNHYSISINNSPNSVVVNQSNTVSVTQNIQNANELVEKIRTLIATDTTIDSSKSSEILECLNEIQNSLKSNQKPKFAIKSLIELAGEISSIGSWVTSLGQIVGVIPGI